MVFNQAYAIRVLNYSVDELGTLTFINLAFLAAGNLLSPTLLHRYRDRRVSLWKIFASLNIVSWALTGFSDLVPGRYALYIFVAMAQLSGAIANLAYSDTIADMIPREESVKVFSRVSTLNTSSALIALTSSITLFSIMGPHLLSYRICYTASLITALASSTLLSMMKDLTRRSPIKLGVSDVLRGYQNIMNNGKIKNYIVFMIMFTFFVNLPAALWNYYIINIFNGSETWISMNTIAATLALSIGNYILSRVYHRIEPKTVLIISIIPISLFPLLFLISYTMEYQALLNMFSGFGWAAFNLIVGIYNLYIANVNERIYMLSILGVASNLAAAISSKLGSFIASINLLAMQSIFIASFIGRVLMYVYGKKRLPNI